jgi:hypothetical protein
MARSIRKLSLSSARSANPGQRGGRLSAATKRAIAGALAARSANPKTKGKGKGKGKKGKKAQFKKGSAAAKAWGREMARLRAAKAGKKGKGKGKGKGKAGKKMTAAQKKALAKARAAKAAKGGKKGKRSRMKGTMKGSLSGVVSLRAANGRRRNPGFDVKRALIESAVLVGGTFAAAFAMPHITKFLEGTLGLSGSTLGYAKIVGAALTVVGGAYAQDRFGAKLGFDLQPATYAIATFMAHDGLIAAGLVDAPATGGGTFALTGPAAGTMELTGPSMNGYLPSINDPNAMLGTGMGATVLANLPETNAMLGSIFTAGELPYPPVSPHNVMQGNQVAVPQMC